MCSASDDMTLRLWDPHEGAMLRTLPGHTNYVLCCTFNSQGNTLVCGGVFLVLAGGTFVEGWQVTVIRDIILHTNRHLVALMKQYACGMYDRGLNSRCVDVYVASSHTVSPPTTPPCNPDKHPQSIPAHSDPVTAVDFIHDGTLLVSSSLDGLCRLWDAHTSACHGTMINQGEGPPVSYVRFTPNGQYILRATLHESAMSLWAWQPKAGNRATFKIKRVYKGRGLGHGGCSTCVYNMQIDILCTQAMCMTSIRPPMCHSSRQYPASNWWSLVMSNIVCLSGTSQRLMWCRKSRARQKVMLLLHSTIVHQLLQWTLIPRNL